MAKFKWTRKRFYKAKHLSRLLCQMPVSEPPLVDLYHQLLSDHYDSVGRRDPLSEPIKYRLARFADDDIPF